MRVRSLEERDIPRLRALQNEFEWKLGRDFIGASVVVDANDIPRMIAGAWSLAEVHLVSDREWGTPEMRAQALNMLHESMNQQLRARGIRRGVTWFDSPMKAFERRLRKMGWIRSEVSSYHKEVQ